MTNDGTISLLASLAHYDNLRASAANNTTRVQNVDVIAQTEEEEIALCHIPILSPLSRLRDTREIEFGDEFENIAAALLAMEHFNTGNGRIIPEIKGIDKKCNVRFTTELVDTEHAEPAAVEQVINIVSRSANNPNKPLPCAFFGSTRSSVCIPTAIVTGIKGYPQFSPECTSPQLNNPDQFPLFGRLVNSDDGTAFPVIRWLQQRAQVDNLAVLYRDDSYGIEYARAIQHMAQEIAPTMKIELVVIPYDGVMEEDFDRAIQQLKETEFRYIFGIISRSLHYDTLMTKAYEMDIAGPDYAWIFSESLGNKLLSREFEPGSPLYMATQGIGVITPVGGSPGTAIYSEYSKALQELDNPSDLAYLKSKLPQYFVDVDPNDLQTHLDNLHLGQPPKETFSSLGYDTIIAMGQAACAASASNEPGTYFSGPQHFEAIVQQQFQGLSGNIDLDPNTGSRKPESALFNIINFVPNDDDKSFRGVVTDVFESGAWVNQEPYLFHDGTSVAPLDLPMLNREFNYIGTPLRAIGLSLASVILLASIGFALWTHWKRNTRVVRASQPIFLSLICVGTLLMGASIIPLSIDDQIASVAGCNIACMSTWWLMGIGIPIALSALVTKTNRIVRIVYVGSFRRVRIGAGDVMVPMVVFIGANVVILSLWTALSPLQWVRETIAEDNFGRPSESFGHCYSEGGLPYIITLCIVNFSCLVAGVTQAYKARHLSTDFAESEYIAMAMVMMLVVGFIAIPVAILAEENPGAFFFVITAVVFVCSMSLLLLIFLPKIWSINNPGEQMMAASSRHLRSSLTLSERLQPSFKRQVSSSIISSIRSSATAESGIACVNTEQLLPRKRRENRDLLALTAALQKRIAHLEEEDKYGAGVPESALPRGDSVLHDGSNQSNKEGLKVHDNRKELQEVQAETKRLRKLRKELEARLFKLENNLPFEDDV